jgi:hypothetical protein
MIWLWTIFWALLLFCVFIISRALYLAARSPRFRILTKDGSQFYTQRLGVFGWITESGTDSTIEYARRSCISRKEGWAKSRQKLQVVEENV